jgi:hypothetical protein
MRDFSFGFLEGRALSRPQILGHAGACPSNC